MKKILTMVMAGAIALLSFPAAALANGGDVTFVAHEAQAANGGVITPFADAISRANLSVSGKTLTASATIYFASKSTSNGVYVEIQQNKNGSWSKYTGTNVSCANSTMKAVAPKFYNIPAGTYRAYFKSYGTSSRTSTSKSVTVK